MNRVEAAECAVVIGVKYVVTIHMAPGKLFVRSIAEGFKAPNRIIIVTGEERV